MITYIKTECLDHHPDNPRKELGDLTELAASIRQRGVLQNLTVVPQPSKDDVYTVVIGHRRLEAAKLAHLDEVPCVIVEMTPKTQIATMLQENIQRSDLTVYEQAQGFQMMLNLGDTVSTISNQTGFSESTVRRRVSLLELDQEKFKKSVERGATLMDFAELDKIKDIARKNKVLDDVGTSNFKWALKQAIEAEEKEKQYAAWREALSVFATEIDSVSGYHRCRYFPIGMSIPDDLKPADSDTREYFFFMGQYGSIQLMSSTADEVEEDPEEIARRALIQERRLGLTEAAKRAFELRKEFVKHAGPTRIKMSVGDILAFIFQQLNTEGYVRISMVMMDELLSVKWDADNEDGELLEEAVSSAVSNAPEKALLAIAYCISGDKATASFTDFQDRYSTNYELGYLYELLQKLGYDMSDEEKALMDGTHELYGEPEQDDNDEAQRADS